MTDTEVTIIGGGVYGAYPAIRLLEAGIVDRQTIGAESISAPSTRTSV